MYPADAQIITQLERIALALEAINTQLETLTARLDAALGPGSGGRDSVTILDQLCALSDDSSAIASHLELPTVEVVTRSQSS
jgi:hypothetical protein